MKPTWGLAFSFLALLLCAAPASSRAQTPGAQETAAPMRGGYQVRIFEVKHRDPNILVDALTGLMSGTGPSRMTANQALKTITVRDLAENMVAIEAALKRLDQPTAPAPFPVNLDFQLHLIAASRSATEKSPLPAGLEAVINQLQPSLKYTSYRYVTSATSRVNDGGRIEGNGVTAPPFPFPSGNPKSYYAYTINNARIVTDATGRETIQIRQLKFSISIPIDQPSPGVFNHRDIGLVTEMSLREGEMAVIGTASIGQDEAIIVAISARKVR